MVVFGASLDNSGALVKLLYASVLHLLNSYVHQGSVVPSAPLSWLQHHLCRSYGVGSSFSALSGKFSKLQCTVGFSFLCLRVQASFTWCLRLLACLLGSSWQLLVLCLGCWAHDHRCRLIQDHPCIHGNKTLYTSQQHEFNWSYCHSITKIT